MNDQLDEIATGPLVISDVYVTFRAALSQHYPVRKAKIPRSGGVNQKFITPVKIQKSGQTMRKFERKNCLGRLLLKYFRYRSTLKTELSTWPSENFM